MVKPHYLLQCKKGNKAIVKYLVEHRSYINGASLFIANMEN